VQRQEKTIETRQQQQIEMTQQLAQLKAQCDK